MKKVNIEKKLSQFSDYWNPKVVGALNGQEVELIKFKGIFPWYKHEKEDELFFVVKGDFNMEFRDRTVHLKKQEFLIVPKGTEHPKEANKEVSVMFFEPAKTLNTGDQQNEFTKPVLSTI